MNDDKKSKKQLVEEVRELRHRVAQLEREAASYSASLDASERRARELEALYQISLATMHELEPERLLARLYQEVLQLLKPDTFVVVRYAPAEDEITVMVAVEEGAPLTSVASMRVPMAEAGLTGWVIRNGTSLLVGDLQNDPLPTEPRHQTRPATSWIGVPLMVGDQLMGAVSVQSFTAHAFTEEDCRFLEAASGPIASALQTAQLFHDAQRRAEELEVLRDASLRLTSSLELRQVLEAVLEAVMRLMENVTSSHIFLYSNGRLTFGAALEPSGFKDKPFSEPRAQGLTHTVARTGEMIVVGDFQDHPLFVGAPAAWKGSIVGLPLKIGSRVVGVMNVSRATPYSTRERELHLLRLLADHAAIAIENARLHDLVAQQARTDVLTGLPNRRALNERIESEVSRAERYQHPFALLMMDLDGFKQVNDTYGHPLGDLILQRVAQLLASGTRESDFLARFGGDEFALLLPETGLSCATGVAQKITELVRSGSAEIKEIEGNALSLSIGIAIYPTDASSGGDLLQQADRVLYHVKRSSPGSVASVADLSP